jgi:hypothetical protein
MQEIEYVARNLEFLSNERYQEKVKNLENKGFYLFKKNRQILIYKKPKK